MTPPRRRTARRAVMALAVVVLLPLGYLGSAIAISVAAEAGWIPPPTPNSPIGVAYAPLRWYIESDMPGSQLLLEMASAAQELGSSFR